jgi:hypothetical protein
LDAGGAVSDFTRRHLIISAMALVRGKAPMIDRAPARCARVGCIAPPVGQTQKHVACRSSKRSERHVLDHFLEGTGAGAGAGLGCGTGTIRAGGMPRLSEGLWDIHVSRLIEPEV